MQLLWGIMLLPISALVFGEQTQTTPVRRVVSLLQSLVKKAEQDAKKDLEIYENYVCWAKSVIDQKTATNAAASEKIDELKTFIADMDAGRIEFTGERADLTKELGEVNADIEKADSLNAKENSDYRAAKEEMTQAVAALDKSLKVLKEAIHGHRTGTLLLQRSHSESSEGFAATVQDAAALHHAVEISKQVLSAGDAVFLRHLLTGQVPPKREWKKVNRKATFKMSYKARSLKIETVLQKLKDTFSASLKEAEDRHAVSDEDSGNLLQEKKNLKAELEDQLKKMSVEEGAKGMNKEEAETELDALTEQKTNDDKFIKQTTDSLADTKKAYKARKALRNGEIEALNKAISIINSNDAQTTFRKSFKSQGYTLLQLGSRRYRKEAVAALRKVSESVPDPRLFQLISKVKAPVASHFTDILKSIDTMIADLKKEQESDSKIKEECESDRAKDTRAAAKVSRTMDEKTDKMAKLQDEIAEITSEIKDKTENIETIEKEVADAKAIRDKEKAEFETEAKDDSDAKQIIKETKDVLNKFYSDNGLSLFQQPKVIAGKAPPPPPATWEAPYGGKTEETTSILALMDMIIADIKDDMEKASAAEEKAQKEFETFEAKSKDQIKGLKDAIVKLTDSKAEKADKSVDVGDENKDLKTELDGLMTKLDDAVPACEYFMENYPMRRKNRDVEIDGLYKAKTFLKGGTFAKAGRELKPGDTLF